MERMTDSNYDHTPARRNPSILAVAEAVRAYKLAEENRKEALRLQLEAEKRLVRPRYR